MSKYKKYSIDTICVKDDEVTQSGQSHVLPIHASSSFSYKTIDDSIEIFQKKKPGYVYSRYGNPTVSSVENKLAAMEGIGLADPVGCLMTSSGLSAISTFALALLSKADEVITQKDLYGGTTELFKKVISKLDVKIHEVDLNDLDQLEQILKSNPKVKLIYMETPSNPTLNCLDITAIAKLAKNYETYSAIDNTFCTCYIQKPFVLGVDFVLYSTTKFLNGHGNSIAGAILCKDQDYREQLWDTMKLVGTNCNAWDAWLLHNGLKTLAVRMDKHCSNARSIAQFLENHDRVKKVNYPGLESHSTHKQAVKQMSQFGGMISFEIDGNLEAGKSFMDNTQLCTIAATLGNVDTLLLHPATSSHLNIPKATRESCGITDGLIRISVGIENVEDLIADIDQALQTIS